MAAHSLVTLSLQTFPSIEVSTLVVNPQLPEKIPAVATEILLRRAGSPDAAWSSLENPEFVQAPSYQK